MQRRWRPRIGTTWRWSLQACAISAIRSGEPCRCPIGGKGTRFEQLPFSRWRTVLANFAACGSCVTMMIVLPYSVFKRRTS